MCLSYLFKQVAFQPVCQMRTILALANIANYALKLWSINSHSMHSTINNCIIELDAFSKCLKFRYIRTMNLQKWIKQVVLCQSTPYSKLFCKNVGYTVVKSNLFGRLRIVCSRYVVPRTIIFFLRVIFSSKLSIS